MYIDKFTYWLMFSLFGMIISLAIIECVLKHTKFKLSRKNLSITICLITLIVAYTILFKFFHGGNWIGDYINSFVAMGTVALGIFAWMAYRYATKQYVENTMEQLKISSKVKINEEIINIISTSLMTVMKCISCYESISSRLDDYSRHNKNLTIAKINENEFNIGEHFEQLLQLTYTLYDVNLKINALNTFNINQAEIIQIKEFIKQIRESSPDAFLKLHSIYLSNTDAVNDIIYSIDFNNQKGMIAKIKDCYQQINNGLEELKKHYRDKLDIFCNQYYFKSHHDKKH